MSKVTKAATAGAVAVGIASGALVYINADGGGYVYDYVHKYDQMYIQGVRIAVTGACYSSCTVVLAYPNACLGPNAILGFHPAYVPYLWGQYYGGWFSYSLNPEATNEMRRHYPPDALAVINRYHGLDDKGGWFRPEITLIKAGEFPARYRC